MNIALIALSALIAFTLPAQAGATPAEPPTDTIDAPAITPIERADLLSVLPNDTWAVLMVRDLTALDEKLKPLIENGRFPARLLPFLKNWMGIVDGLDARGSMAVAWMKTEPSEAIAGRLAILLPMKDQAALTMFWNPRPMGNGLVKVTLAGRESYLGTKGGFAVVASDPATTQVIVESTTRLDAHLSSHAQAQSRSNDVFMWSQPARIAQGELFGAGGSWFRQTFGVEAKDIEALGALHVAGRLNADGLALETCFEESATDGGLAQLDTTVSLMRGLPHEPYVVAMGMVDDEEGHRLTSLQRLMIPLLVAAQIIDANQAAEMEKVYDSLAGKIAGMSVSVSSLPKEAGVALGMTKILRAHGDSRALLSEVEIVVALLQTGPFVDPKLNALAKRLVYRRAAETCDGFTIDHLLVDVKDDQSGQYETLKSITGPDGILWRIGAVDEKHVVATFGGGLPRFKKAAATVQSGEAPLAADSGIVRSGNHVSPNRSLEAYIAVDRLNRIGPPIAAALGTTWTHPAWSNLTAPIALSVHAVGPGATQVDVFIPTELLTARGQPAAERPSTKPPPPTEP